MQDVFHCCSRISFFGILERGGSDEQLVQEYTKRPDVHFAVVARPARSSLQLRRIELWTDEYFGRHVVEGASARNWARDPCVYGQTKVCKLENRIKTDVRAQDVLGFHIAMNDTL